MGLVIKRKSKTPSENLIEPTTMDRLLQRSCLREEFFLLFCKLLQEKLLNVSIEFSGESTLHIVNSAGQKSTYFLDNLWLRYSHGGEDRRELIEKYVRLAASLGSSEPATRQNIVATVKDLTYLSTVENDAEQVVEHLCGDLWIVYAVDAPETISSLTRAQMNVAGVQEADLRILAIENLKRILPEVECQGDGPSYLLTAGTDYVASLLLFDDIWDHLKDSVDGEIVATVPSRDVLMYTGSNSAEGISFLREKSEEIVKNGSHVISNSLIRRCGRTWTVFSAN